MDIILYIFITFIIFYLIRKAILIKTIRHYSPVDASQLFKQSKSVLLLDVRTNAERKNQKINGSHHIPLAEIGGRASELIKFKEKVIICYCRTGNRSLSAAAKLKRHGFNVANLKGGIVQWNAVGLR
jgi:rhodanese-related sulfurtransferase